MISEAARSALAELFTEVMQWCADNRATLWGAVALGFVMLAVGAVGVARHSRNHK